MIDFEAIAQRIYDSAVGVLGEGASLVESKAKARAPVRQVFAGGSGIRVKTASEIEGAREARARVFKPVARALGKAYRAETGGTIATKAAPRQWHSRRLGAAEGLLGDYNREISARRSARRAGVVRTARATALSASGASEVRTKRAKFTTFQHAHIGGRLRGEIYATSPTVSGHKAEAWVISPTPYARHMEFGTRHAAAHPFLRPASEESRSEIVSRIAAAVRAASRTDASSANIEIVVRL